MKRLNCALTSFSQYEPDHPKATPPEGKYVRFSMQQPHVSENRCIVILSNIQSYIQ